MPHQAIELALVDVDTGTHRSERRINAAAGPGWFDSSWDLHRGLEVRESWSDDDQLDCWIDDFLATQRVALFTASPSASTAIA